MYPAQQAAVSRNLQALERVLGVRLLHRTSRSVTLTTAGVHVLAQARQLLAAADNLVAEATTGHAVLRVGHPWAAMGRRTREFLRRWAAEHPETSLDLIRVNSPTGGLAEGMCDIAVLRTAVDDRRYSSEVVGHERRYCALAADDPWARRRSISLGDVAERTVVIDSRIGTTTGDLWPPDRLPACATPTTSTTGCPSSRPATRSASPRKPPLPSTSASASSSGRCAMPRPSTSG